MSLSYCPNLRQILSICVLTAMIFHPDVLAAESAGEEATRLEPGSVLRLDAFDSDQAPAFGIDLPGSGILTLDAVAAGPDGGGAEIVLLPESGRWETSGVAVLERSAAHLTAAVYGAGPLVFRVASGDPRSPAVRVKIATGFTPATVIEDAFLGGTGSGGAIRSRFYAGVLVKVDPEAVDPDPGIWPGGSPAKVDPEAVDPDPGIWPGGLPPVKVDPEAVDPDPGSSSGIVEHGRLLASIATWHNDSLRLKVDPEAVDPDPGWHNDSPWAKVDPEAVDPDPGKRRSETVLHRQVLFHQRACAIAASPDEADDYADVAACAAPLHPDRPLVGDLANRWHDDSDVFSFVLEEPATVDLTTHGDTDTLGELRDAAGRILATDDDGGDHRNFRLMRTLPAGRYFVRVQGAGGAEGPYQLSMTSRNR